MMLELKYSVMESEYKDEHPMLAWAQSDVVTGQGKLIEISSPLKFRVSDPVPDHIEWPDLLHAPEPVISIRLARILADIQLAGIQLLPAIIEPVHSPFDEPIKYVFLHVLHQRAALDRNRSEITTNTDGDLIFGIHKLAIADNALQSIPENQRLIFELKEEPSVILVHDKLRALIESIQPTGIKFYKVPEWNSDVAFD